MVQYISKSDLVVEIESLKKFYNRFDDNIQSVAKYNVLVDIISFIDTLEVKEVQEEPVSNDLEEFALQYAGHHAPYDSCMQEVEDAVKAGAQWQKQQTISKACKWIEEKAARYIVDRFVGSTRVVGIDTSITKDFRKDIEDEIQSKV